MGSIEDVGETIIKLLNRVFYYAVGVLIWLIRVSRAVGRRAGIDIYPYFEKRNIELKDYTVLKAQTATLIFLMSAVVFIFGLLGIRTLALLFLVFGLYSLHLTLVQLKQHYSDDYPAYRVFFLSYLAISVLLVVARIVKPTVSFVFPFFHLLLLATISVVGVSFIFKQKYGRDYTFGRVVKAGDFITVRVNYDLLSSVKPGAHTFENRANAEEGDIIKLLVESSKFNVSGSRVVGPVQEE